MTNPGQKLLFDLPDWEESAQTTNGQACKNGSMQVAQLAGLFLAHLRTRVQARRLSQANYDNSERDLERFAAYADRFQAKHGRPINDDDFVAWVCQPAYASDWTKRRVRGLILRFFRWAAKPKIGYIKECPFDWPDDVRFAKPRRPNATPAEYMQFMRGAHAGKHAGKKNRGNQAIRRILFFLWHTAVRPEEARELTVDQVDLKEGVAVIYDHKTIHQQGDPEPRIVGLDLPTTRLLGNLIRRLPDGEKHVFLADRGEPWTKNNLSVRIADLRKKLGIKRKLTSYSFRHGAATEADEGGVNERAIADQLGHTSTKMIKVYSHAAQQRRHLRRVAREMHQRRREVRRRKD